MKRWALASLLGAVLVASLVLVQTATPEARVVPQQSNNKYQKVAPDPKPQMPYNLKKHVSDRLEKTQAAIDSAQVGAPFRFWLPTWVPTDLKPGNMYYREGDDGEAHLNVSLNDWSDHPTRYLHLYMTNRPTSAPNLPWEPVTLGGVTWQYAYVSAPGKTSVHVIRTVTNGLMIQYNAPETVTKDEVLRAIASIKGH